MRSLTGWFLCGLIFLANGGLHAAEPDPIKATLDAAKAKYLGEEKSFKEAVLGYLADKEDAARKGKNIVAGKAVIKEREDYLNQGILPKLFSTLKRDTFDNARKTLVKAYKNAEGEYFSQKRDDLASLVQKELVRFENYGTWEAVEATAVVPKKEVVVAPPPDLRILWVHPRGYFVQGEGKDWIEKLHEGDKLGIWSESRRTKDFIEMKGKTEPGFLRIYSDRVEHDSENNGQWKIPFKGRWLKR